MNILILSSYSPFKNNAGVVALDLLNSLNSLENVDARLLTKPFHNKNQYNLLTYNNLIMETISFAKRKYINLLNRIYNYKKRKLVKDPKYLFYDLDSQENNINVDRIKNKISFEPDAIIVLFMDNFLNFHSLYELYSNFKKPIFLYLMDMAPMTGGCHYAWDCKGYTKNCGNCPGLFSNNPKDQTYLNWQFKKEYIDKTNIIPIACTEWQYKQLQKSTLFVNKEKFKIILPIDEKLFKPANRKEIRKKLNLPIEKKIVFIGAVNIDEKRKGFKELIESLKIIKSKLNFDEASNIHLVITGKENDNYKNLLPFEYTPLGYLTHQQIAMVFQAADLFVCPSIEDAGPMMINQSIMCGTPVVSFEMGVAFDLVITGRTGYRAKLKDSSDLALGIKYILELDELEYKKMSDNCLTMGLDLCHPQRQAAKFIEILKKNN